METGRQVPTVRSRQTWLTLTAVSTPPRPARASVTRNIAQWLIPGDASSAAPRSRRAASMARFCFARCRVAWNREKTSDLAAGMSALQWSLTAMSDTTERLARIMAGDPAASVRGDR
jgi:hypothetical protein